MKPIVLFDMDGTLTEPRKNMNPEMLASLIQLSEFCDLGIVTGSSLGYIKQQCRLLIDNVDKLHSRLDLYPCNGTQAYKVSSKKEINCVHTCDIRDELGPGFNDVVMHLLHLQVDFLSEFGKDITTTGTFIQYRKSMINWCPVGRDSDHDIRSKFSELDKSKRVREAMVTRLREKNSFKNWGLEISLGGSTSIDIYPAGWDKRYVLKHVHQPDRKIYFVGDRCTGDGNDRLLYEKLLPEKTAFKTESPSQTKEIIANITNLENSKS